LLRPTSFGRRDPEVARELIGAGAPEPYRSRPNAHRRQAHAERLRGLGYRYQFSGFERVAGSHARHSNQP
jgi:hypothetical protein